MASSNDLVTVAVALFDFAGLRADNLRFKKGDLITVLEMDETGWWKGYGPDGKTGIFPYNYVELRDDLDSFTVVQALYDFEAQNEDQLSFKRGEEFTLIKELSVDWWKGRKGDDTEGVFPANRVKKTNERNDEMAKKEKERWSMIKKAKKKELERVEKEKRSLERQKAKQRDQEEKERLAKEAHEAAERARRAEEELKALRAEAALLRRQQKQENSSSSARRSVSHQREAIKTQARKSAARWQGMAPGPPPELEEERQKYYAEIAEDDEFGPAPPLETEAILQPKKAVSDLVEKKGQAVSDPIEEVPPSAPEPEKPKRTYNKRFANLGGGSTCVKCGKGVGFADKVTALKGDWHKDCFRCSTCSKVLRQGEWREHNGYPYCHTCHASGFGIKGFGFGGSLAPNVVTGNAKQSNSNVDEKSLFDSLKSKTNDLEA